MITRQDYMKSKKPNIHHEYYAQFVTEETKIFVLEKIGLEKLLKSKDKGLFNDIGIERSHGGAGTWLWDDAPINFDLLRLAQNTGSSLSDRTCTAKAAARIIVAENTSI